MLSRADINDKVKLILGFTFKNSFLFHVHLTLETITESQFCVSVCCESVSGCIDLSTSVSHLLRFSFSFSLSLFLLPSVFLSPSFLLQVVTTLSSVDSPRKNHHFQPSLCVFYVCDILQEFAYVQITCCWFEISHYQIC